MKTLSEYIIESGAQQMAASHTTFVQLMRAEYKKLKKLKIADNPLIYVNHTSKNKCKLIDDTIENCLKKMCDKYKSNIDHIEYDNDLIQSVIFDSIDNATEAYKSLHSSFIRDIKKLNGKQFDSYQIEIQQIYSDNKVTNTSSPYYFINDCLVCIKVFDTETNKTYYRAYPEICLCSTDDENLKNRINDVKKYINQ